MDGSTAKINLHPIEVEKYVLNCNLQRILLKFDIHGIYLYLNIWDPVEIDIYNIYYKYQERQLKSH